MKDGGISAKDEEEMLADGQGEGAIETERV